MGSLRVNLIQPQGNIDVEEGSNIKVEVAVSRDMVEEGEASIGYNSEFVAAFEEKRKPLPNSRSFTLSWDLATLKKTTKPIQILILVTSGSKFQACAFNLGIY